MALSTNFFGLRKGSTRSLTFAVGHNGKGSYQQTRDVNTGTRKTRMSTRQSSQNIKLCMLALYWRKLPYIKELYERSDYVTQELQQYDWGPRKDAYNEYLTDNLKRTPFVVTSYPIKDTMYWGIGDIVISRGHFSNMFVLEDNDNKPYCWLIKNLIGDVHVKSTKQLCERLINYHRLPHGVTYYFFFICYHPNGVAQYSEFALKSFTARLNVSLNNSTVENFNGDIFVNSDGNLEMSWADGKIVWGGDGKMMSDTNLKVVMATSACIYGNMCSSSRFLVVKDNIEDIVTPEQSKYTYFPQSTTTGGSQVRPAERYYNPFETKRDYQDGTLPT